MKKRYGRTADRRSSKHKNNLIRWIAGFLMLNGSIWVFLSCVLTFCGRESAVALSLTIAAEIIGAAAVYQSKSLLGSPDKRRKGSKAVNRRKKDDTQKED